MKAESEEYLRGLGMGDVLLGRVTEIERSVGSLCPEELKYVFVAEYVEEGGMRQYENLFFFSANYAIQATNFASQSEFDIDWLGKSIVNLKLESKEPDLEKVTDKSRLSVRYVTEANCHASLRASGNNCAHLLAIVRSCLVPNFVGG